MYLYYNGYWFDQNEASISLSRRREYNNTYQLQTEVHSWTVRGIKQAASQPALTTALNLMESYIQDGGDIGLYLDDQATLTSHYLESSGSLGGTRIVNFGYPQGEGAEYSTFRTWEFTIEAAFGPTGALPLIEYNESIAFTGNGGPRRIFLEVAEGLPQEQIVSQHTTYRAVQAGSASQFGSFPDYPVPIWPQALMNPDRAITPNYLGGGKYAVQWNYIFESAQALFGNPHVK